MEIKGGREVEKRMNVIFNKENVKKIIICPLVLQSLYMCEEN